MSEADPMVVEFMGYVDDICSQALEVETRHRKLSTVLSRLVDSALRRAASTLLPLDLDISSLSDAQLAAQMQMHVTSRMGGGLNETIRLPNSAWSMMLEAARRLRAPRDQTTEEMVQAAPGARAEASPPGNPKARQP